MSEVKLEEPPDFEARLSAGLILGPSAMRGFLRAQRYPSQSDDILFDLRTGNLVLGELGIRSLASETGRTDELEAFPDLLTGSVPISELGNYRFDPRLYNGWEDSDFEFGARFLINQANLQERGHRYRINKRIIDRANELGVFPSARQVETRFKNRTNFFARLGIVEVKSIYLELSRAQACRYLVDFHETYGTRPTRSALNTIARGRPLKPGYDALISRLSPGGIAQFEREFGYWPPLHSRDECIEWGLNFMMANQAALPTKHELEIFSSIQTGPGTMSVRKYFDGRISNLHAEISDRFKKEAALRAAVRQNLLADIRSGIAPRILVGKSYSDEQAVCSYARYKLLQSLLPSLPENKKLTLANPYVNNARFILGLQTNGDNVTAIDLSSHAEEIGLYKEVWRSPGYIESYNVEAAVKKYLNATRGKLTDDQAETMEAYIKQGVALLDSRPDLLEDRLYWKAPHIKSILKRLKVKSDHEMISIFDSIQLYGEIVVSRYRQSTTDEATESK